MSSLLQRPSYPAKTESKDQCKDCKFWNKLPDEETWGTCSNNNACYIMRQFPFNCKYRIKEKTVETDQFYGCAMWSME